MCVSVTSMVMAVAVAVAVVAVVMRVMVVVVLVAIVLVVVVMVVVVVVRVMRVCKHKIQQTSNQYYGSLSLSTRAGTERRWRLSLKPHLCYDCDDGGGAVSDHCGGAYDGGDEHGVCDCHLQAGNTMRALGSGVSTQLRETCLWGVTWVNPLPREGVIGILSPCLALRGTR